MHHRRISSEKWDSVIPAPRLGPWTSLLLISVAAFVSYYKSLHAAFVFDDHEAVINNKDVTSLNVSLHDLFLHDFWGASITHVASHKSYRPLTILSFRMLHYLNDHELNPFIFHLVNIILHVLVSCLAFQVYNLLFEMRCPRSSLCCALLFAIHPVHTESVAGVVGQAELLSAFFALLSFIVFHYGCVNERSLLLNLSYSFASCVFSIVAMLCKEQGITIIGVIIMYDIIIVNKLTPSKIWELFGLFVKMLICNNFKNSPQVTNYFEFFDKNWWKMKTFKSNFKCSPNGTNKIVIPSNYAPLINMVARHLVMTVVTVFAIYIRWLLMGSTVPVFQEIDNPASFQDEFVYRVLNYNYIYLINLWILLCPEWLCFDWSMGCIPLIKSDDSKFDFRIILVILFWILILALVYATYRSNGTTQRSLILGITSIFILFSPASNIFFKVGFVVAERVLYLPSMGYFLIVIVGFRKLATFEKLKKVLQYLFVFLVLVFFLRSWRRTEDWLTEKQLFESALSVCPWNAKVHYNLAKNSADSGFKKFAIKHYEEAIKLHPKYDLAMNNLANIYRDEGNLTAAEKLLIKALDIRPDFATAWMNLGIVYSSMGSFNDSEICYLEALKFRKKYPDCYYNLGNLVEYSLKNAKIIEPYLELGRNIDALSAWRNATSLKPTHKIAWSNLIVMLDSMGRLDEALHESYNALSHLQNEPSIHFNLANVLGKLNEYEKSERHFLIAIRLNSTVAAYHYNLGVLYHRWNKFCKAKYHYIEADKLDSSSKAKKQLNILKKSGKIERCFIEGVK